MTIYHLEERTFQFSRSCAILIRQLQKEILGIEFGRQLLRSSSSVGANYNEATESLGEKDFQMKIRISIREAKEAAYWLRLMKETIENVNDDGRIDLLINETVELRRILAAILTRYRQNRM